MWDLQARALDKEIQLLGWQGREVGIFTLQHLNKDEIGGLRRRRRRRVVMSCHMECPAVFYLALGVEYNRLTGGYPQHLMGSRVEG